VIIKDSDETDSNTDSDSSYISDGEASLPIHNYRFHGKNHGSGPVKLYLKERFGNWPKYRYKKYKRSHMKKHGIQINYGNIHTKDIKCSLHHEKRQRKRDEHFPSFLMHMMEDLPEHTSFLSLDPQHPVRPIQTDKSHIKTNEDERKHRKSRLRKMKNKVKKSLKRTKKETNHITTYEVQVEISIDDSSEISDNEEHLI
jgi:hypothetical protein